MKNLTMFIVILSIIAIILGVHFDLFEARRIASKELLWNVCSFLLSLAIFIELYYDDPIPEKK